MGKFDQKIPLRIGLICFGAVIVLGLIMYIFYEIIASSFWYYAIIGLCSLTFAISMGVWSGVQSRRENGGVISFGNAFGAVYIVFVLYILGGNVSQLLVNKVIDREYPTKLYNIVKQKMSDQFEASGMSDDDIKKAMKRISPEKFDPPIAQMLESLGYTLCGSAVIALIIALILKKNQEDLLTESSQ